MENRVNGFAAIEYSVAYRISAFLKSTPAVRIAISVVTFLAFFVILVFDGEPATFGAAFVMVTTTVVLPYALIILLWIMTVIEVLTENIVDCIFPRNPTSEEALVAYKEAQKEHKQAQKAYRKMSKQERQELQFREKCRPYSLTLKEYIKIKQSKNEQVTAQEARHFWYFLAEYIRLSKRIEPGDVYNRIHLEQLKELHPEYTKNYSVDQLTREFEKYCLPGWELVRNNHDPACTRVLQIMLEDFVETFSKNSGNRYAERILSDCALAALNKYEVFASK